MAVDTATAAHTCATAVIAATTYALIITVMNGMIILVGSSSSMIVADVIVFGIVDVTAAVTTVGAVRVVLVSTGQGDKGRLGRRSRITGRHGIISRDRL